MTVPEIRIRGVGTFEHNDPMVLIDGVESSVSQIAEIPADDIESVSVLKMRLRLLSMVCVLQTVLFW